jgi:hypothetical protein
MAFSVAHRRAILGYGGLSSFGDHKPFVAPAKAVPEPQPACRAHRRSTPSSPSAATPAQADAQCPYRCYPRLAGLIESSCVVSTDDTLDTLDTLDTTKGCDQ